MKKILGIKKIMACAAALTISMTAFAAAGAGAVDSSASSDSSVAESENVKKKNEEISGTQSKLDELTKKQAELDKKIQDTKGDINAEKENQDAIEEQIVTVQQTILALTQSIDETEEQIVELEASIEIKEAQIEEKRIEIEQGVADFKQRLRTMYVAGNSSYSDIIIGASDFYDMLMKIELVKRVAEHDDEMIDDLIALQKQYEQDEAELNDSKARLEKHKADLVTQQEAHNKQRIKLEELFSQSQRNLDQLAADKAIYENNLAVIQEEQAAFEEEIMKLFNERQAILEEEERQRKEEEERKRKEEEERLRKEAEEKARKEAEEKARLEAEAKAKKEAEEKAAREAAERAAQQNNTTNNTTTNTNTNTNTNTTTEPDNGYTTANPKDDAGTGTDANGNSTSTDAGTGVTTGNQVTNDNAYYGYVDKSQFTWPCPGFYHISYGVGWRWGSYHQGIDIWSYGIRGANICAAAAGEVIYVNNYCPHDYGKNYSCGCGGGYGKYCIIDHGNGYWTLYGHSQNIIVSVGQHVEQGQVLGYVGSTGHSTGDHLHFEVRINGVAQDPTNYV